MLTDSGMVSTTATGVTFVLGGAVSGGSNVVYQLSTKELADIELTDMAVATAVGALTQGKGLAGSVGINMGGAYFGSVIKQEEPTAPVMGAGVGLLLLLVL
ncbi:MAG: hypothetical protein RBR45_08025 [Pseudomonas sp.]|nr:hypothetical protein [Pseudomonas sp.]